MAQFESAFHQDQARKGEDTDLGVVQFEAISPGHCRTAFNGYQGTRDPLEGADVVGELVWSHLLNLSDSTGGETLDPEGNGPGFWETKGSDRHQLKIISW